MKTPLALLTLVLLAVGCHKNTGESQTPPSGPVDATVRDAGQEGDAGPSGPVDRPRQEVGAPSGPSAQGGDRAAVESCVDRWLKEHKLDSYGSPEGTMYAGGSPLFNEATGESRDRLDYVFSRQPEARKACADKASK